MIKLRANSFLRKQNLLPMNFVDSNGTSIAYDDLGKGEPSILLISGWCGPRTYYRDLVKQLSTKRRCLVIDWPGHGDSELPKKDFGEEELVRASIEVLKKSGAQRVVIVSAAHSGWVAIDLVRQLPEQIEALVFLDWLVLEPPKQFLDALKGLQDSNDWKQVRDALFSEWLSESTDQKITQYVQDEMGVFGFNMWSRAGSEIEASYNRYHSPLDALEKLGSPPTVLHIFSIPKDEKFLKAQQEFARTHRRFRVERLEGKTHFPALEDPLRVSVLIENVMN